MSARRVFGSVAGAVVAAIGVVAIAAWLAGGLGWAIAALLGWDQ